MFYKNAISWDLPTIYSSREQEKSFKLNFNHQEVHEVPCSKIQKGGNIQINCFLFYSLYPILYITHTWVKYSDPASMFNGNVLSSLFMASVKIF